jgi:hypothetical protein
MFNLQMGVSHRVASDIRNDRYTIEEMGNVAYATSMTHVMDSGQGALSFKELGTSSKTQN